MLRLRRLREQETLKTRMLMIKLRWPRNIKSLSEDNFQSGSLNEEKTNVGISVSNNHKINITSKKVM